MGEEVEIPESPIHEGKAYDALPDEGSDSFGLDNDDEWNSDGAHKDEEWIKNEEAKIDRILADLRLNNEEDNSMDAFLESIGGFGPKQRNLTLVLACACFLIPALSTFMSVFTAPDSPLVTCTDRSPKAPTTITTTDLALCNHSRPIEFSNPHTITAEFGLVGDRAWLVDLLPQGFFAGYMCGAVVFGLMSDAIGRADTVIFSAVVTALLNLLTICCFSYWPLFAARALYGVSNAALTVSSWVLMVECWGPAERSSVGSLVHLPYPLGMLLATLFASVIPQWRLLVVVESIVQIAVCVWFSKVLMESPRWLMTQHRVTEATAVLRKLAVANAAQMPRFVPNRPDTKGPFNLCGVPAVRVRLVGLAVVWFVAMLGSYDLNFGSESISNNAIVNIAALAAVEVPAFLIGVLVLPLGRRSALIGFLLLSSAALFGSTMTYPEEAIRLMFVCIAKFSVSGALNVLFVFTSELIPTASRGAGLGLCVAVGRLGAVIAPVFLQLAKMERTLPLNLCGQVTLLGAFATILLPETVHHPLPESKSDVVHPPSTKPTSPQKPRIGKGGELDYPDL